MSMYFEYDFHAIFSIKHIKTKIFDDVVTLYTFNVHLLSIKVNAAIKLTSLFQLWFIIDYF